jgi:hypothetical protein
MSCSLMNPMAPDPVVGRLTEPSKLMRPGALPAATNSLAAEALIGPNVQVIVRAKRRNR